MPSLQTVKQRVAEADALQNTGGLLTRKVEAAVQSMLKSKLRPNQPWDKITVVDRSGSMGSAYPDHVQTVLDRDLAFSAVVSDAGKVPVIFFDDRIEELTVELNNFYGLIAKKNIRARGTTDLTKALRRVAEITGNVDVLTGEPTKRLAEKPAFVSIVFDGAPDDKQGAMDVIRRLSWRAVEFKGLYVGKRFKDAAQKKPTPGWQFLLDLDDNIPVGKPFSRGGRLFDNFDAKDTETLAGMNDADYYDAMFDEVPKALQDMREHKLLVA